MRAAVILPAAGLSTRMGKGSPETAGTSRKQFMLLDGSPILVHTIRKFAASPRVHEIVVAVRGDDLEWISSVLADEEKQTNGRVRLRTVEGGNSRQESVENAFRALDPATEIVAVHDAVRPLVSLDTIERVLHDAHEYGAAIVGIVPVDTVKQVSGAQATGVKIRATIPRERLVLAQTPQVFRYELLRRAFDAARQDSFTGTDESSLVERLDDCEIRVVAGSTHNIKITKPEDMDLARLFLAQETARA